MSESAGPVKVVAKAAEILTAFNPDDRRLTVREISERTGIPRSTVHEIAATLVEAKFLERGVHGGLELGLALALLGGQVVEQRGLVDAAQAPMRRHLERFRTEVHVASYFPGSVFYSYLRPATGRPATSNRTGRRWLITESGCGRSILAALSPRARESEFPPSFEGAARARLDHEIRGYRVNGYLVTNVSETGMLSIAAPVRNEASLPMGAIGIGDTIASMTKQRVAEIGRAIRITALETSTALGFIEPRRPAD